MMSRAAVTGRLSAFVLMLIACGCSSAPIAKTAQSFDKPDGSFHTVAPGETLWKVAHAYGVDIQAIVQKNELDDPNRLISGQQLFIPLPPDTDLFFWPLRGAIQPTANPNGLVIAGPAGDFIRASRRGNVAVAANAVRGFGKTVLLEHGDAYMSIYAGLDEMLVRPGESVLQGEPIGRLGGQGLYFEIRQFSQPQQALALLPNVER